jgi:capsular polysaccharide biosynthesis protein
MSLMIGVLQNRITYYESTAVMLIKPPLSATSGEVGGANPDRFVETQIGLMKSAGFIDRIVAALPTTETRQTIRSAVTITQRPNSDVVDITALTDNPERSRRVATVVSDTYMATFPERNRGRFTNELKKVDEQLTELTKELERVEERRLRLPENPTSTGDRAAAARLNTQTDTLNSQLNQLRATRSQLELNSDLISQTEIIQQADEASPAATRASLLTLAAGFLGIAVGVALAVSLASGPRRILTEDEIGDALGHPVVISTPSVRELRRLSMAATGTVGRAFDQAVDRLAVRADAAHEGDAPLSVLVTGTGQGVGTSTLAMALAGRFAATGVRTILVDGNNRKPDITRLFVAPTPVGDALEFPSTPSLVFPSTPSQGLDALFSGSSVAKSPTATRITNLFVLAVGRRVPLDRSNVYLLLERLDSQHVDVIVIDGGPLADLMSTTRLSHLVDVTALAVPHKFRGESVLTAIRRIHDGAPGSLFPVMTSPARRLPVNVKSRVVPPSTEQQ